MLAPCCRFLLQVRPHSIVTPTDHISAKSALRALARACELPVKESEQMANKLVKLGRFTNKRK